MTLEFLDFIKTIDSMNEREIPLIPTKEFDNGIMVVEDEETNILVMKLYLKNYGNKVAYLRNGVEAVNFYSLCIKEEIKVSIILMDLNMPLMNGKEAALKIRELEKASNLRPTTILALSANVIAIDKERLGEFGFDGSYLKPISNILVNELIRDVIK